MKLNLGAGDKPLDGYVNVDFKEGAGIDVVHDLRLPLPMVDGSAGEIYAKHIIEHFTRTEWPAILSDWVRVLASGGTLIIECPDMVRVAENIASNKYGLRWLVWNVAMFGEDGPGMRHQQGFDIPRLVSEMAAVGLTVTRARNWHDDYPEHIDDRSWHYNLRIEAVKP